MATRPPVEILSIPSLQSHAGEGVVDQPTSFQGDPVAHDVEGVAMPTPFVAVGHVGAAVSTDGVGNNVEDGAPRVEENVVPLREGEKSMPSLVADISATAGPPQLCPIIAVANSTEHTQHIAKPEKHKSVNDVSRMTKVCNHCGTATDRAKAKKCHHCHKFYAEHCPTPSPASPCPSCHYSGRFRPLDKTSPHQCKQCGRFVPGEGAEGVGASVGHVDPKASLCTPEGSITGGNVVTNASSSSKDTLLGRKEGGGGDEGTTQQQTTAPVCAPPPASEHEQGGQGNVSSTAARGSKACKLTGVSAEQQPQPQNPGGYTDTTTATTTTAAATAVVSSAAVLVPTLFPTTFVSCLPILHTTTTTVGAALLNISNSSHHPGGGLDDRFVSSLHPVGVVELGGGASPHLRQPFASPPNTADATLPYNPSSARPHLASTLPVMIGMGTTIGDALNYVMTRTSPQGSPAPVLVPPSPPVAMATATAGFQPVCTEPSNLATGGVIAALSNPGAGTLAESGHQSDTLVAEAAAGPARAMTGALVVPSPNESVLVPAPSLSVVHPTGDVITCTQAGNGAAPLPGSGSLVGSSDDRTNPASEAVGHASPSVAPDPSAVSLPDPGAALGSLPPPLYKDSDGPPPQPANEPSEVHGDSGEPSHFFSAKFRNQYSHLEKMGEGKGLKRSSTPEGGTVNPAVKKMKGANVSPDLIGVPLSQLGQQPGSLIRTEVLGVSPPPPPPRQVVAPVTTQFQKHSAVAKPNVAGGGAMYQKVSGSPTAIVPPTTPATATATVPLPTTITTTTATVPLPTTTIAQGNTPVSLGKTPVRPTDAVRPTPIRPASNLHSPHPSPLQALHLSLHSHNYQPPTLQQHPSTPAPSPQALLTTAANHSVHTATPTSGLLPIPPLVKTSSVVASQAQPTSPATCANTLLYTNNFIQNVLLRPTLASTAVMGSVTAQLLKPQGEAKPGTTVVRVLSPTPPLSTGQQPARNKVSAMTVYPTIALTTSLAPSPATVRSASAESKMVALSSQGGRDHSGGGTSARTSPPLVPGVGLWGAKVVYTSTITGPRSSPGAIDGMDGMPGKIKMPLGATPPASVELQKLTCVIQSRIRQALDKEPEGSSVEQQKGLCLPSPPPPPPPSAVTPSTTSRPHIAHTSLVPPKMSEGSCTSTWMPPLMGPPLVPMATASDKATQALMGPGLLPDRGAPGLLPDRGAPGLVPDRGAPGQSFPDRLVSFASVERVAFNSAERPVSTASVATFTERYVGTSTERSVGTSTERPLGPSNERCVGTATERSVGTATERSVGTATERSIGTSTERSVTSYERVVSPLERTAPVATEKTVVTSLERVVGSAVETPSYSSCSAAAANELGKEEHRTDLNGITASQECEPERNGEKYFKLRSDEAMESGSEENSEGGNANSASRKPRDAFGHDRGQEESHSPRGGEGEEETGNGKTEEVLKDNLVDGGAHIFSVKLKDCFLHHVMWNNYKMVFLVPQFHGSRPTSSEPLQVKVEEDVPNDEGVQGKKRSRKQVPQGDEEEEEEEEADMECEDSNKDASPTQSQSAHPLTPCFSVYELRTKLFSAFSPSAVYVYTYKNNIRSYKPPIHWVYVMKRMGGVQDTCHTCRLLGMQHVKNICDYYRIKLPSVLDSLGRNEMPSGRKVIDLSHIRSEELDQEHLDLIPSCAFMDTPSKVQPKIARKRGRKAYLYAPQGEQSPPPLSEQSEPVDNTLDQCDGCDDNNSFYSPRYQSVGKKKPCPQCGTNILKKCKKCPLCGKTFGLFAFGRRQCTSCGRVNLAKYTSCNKCGANLQNAPIALPKDDEIRDSPQPAPEYVCKRRRMHALPATYSSHNHDDGETPLGGTQLSRNTSTASEADEEMVDYEFDEEEDCPDDSELSMAKSPIKSRHTGYQYGRVPWANTEVAVLVDEKGVLRFCLHELCTRVLTEHSKVDVFDMVKDLNLPMEQGDVSLLKKLQALGMHSNRSPICRLIVAEDLWALLDALQEPVPDEVHQHLETVTLTTPLNSSFSSPPAPPPVSRPSQLTVCRSPEPVATPSSMPVQDSPALNLNPGTTPVIAEDESGFESTLHELQCSDGQYVSILRAWNGGQYVCLPEVWRKYFPEVNRNNLTGVLKKLELDTHLPTGQQATLLRSAGVISLRGAPGRLMKVEDMQALLDSIGIPLQIGTGGKAPTPAKQGTHQTTPKPRPTSIVPKPVAPRVCDERPTPVQRVGLPSNIDSRLAQCMQNVLTALGPEDIENLLKERARTASESSVLAEQEANGVASELNGVEQLIAARRELCLVLNKEIGYLRATTQGYMAEIVRLSGVQKQAFQDVEDLLASHGALLNS